VPARKFKSTKVEEFSHVALLEKSYEDEKAATSVENKEV
jgi:hypothetical protein